MFMALKSVSSFTANDGGLSVRFYVAAIREITSMDKGEL